VARDPLPQLEGELYITDGGMETTLIFHHGVDLPHFASFDLLKDAAGRQLLRDYYASYVSLARELGVGLLLDTPTWRANRDWGAKLGYSEEALEQVNRDAVSLVDELRGDGDPPILVSGAIGPRGDGYQASSRMSTADATRYHAPQVEALASSGADLLSVLTMTYAEEPAGVVRAASAAEIPISVSFTVETDGRLPSGQSLRDALEQVDAETDGATAYFMINCAHPTHFADAIEAGEPWVDRIVGLRANASAKSHAELDESDELDDGDPAELGDLYAALRPSLPRVSVIGGCCGTDHRHIGAMCRSWSAAA
jgi:S-methylmethionine-dependent homocysteine/selenocysteine methylase